MLTVGLDVHQKTSTVCILDENGRHVKTWTLAGRWPKLMAKLAKIPRPWQVCFEATCGYGYLHRQLSRMAERVVMAHPGQLRLIFRSKRKSDRVDAKKLATLLYLDQVPAAHVPPAEVQEWRQLIEWRRRLVDRQTMSKNSIRSLLRTHGVIAPRRLWSRKGLAWLAAAELPSETARLRRDMLLEQLAATKSQVTRVTRVLDRIGQRHPGVLVLTTIPGVGLRTAETIVAYVDDAKRFGRGSQVAAYFGIIPCQDASAGTNRLGHITRQGPPTARKYLVQATWQGVRRSAAIRAYFERIGRGQKPRRKIALVATAHYVLRCMFAMLRTGEAWREAA